MMIFTTDSDCLSLLASVRALDTPGQGKVRPGLMRECLSSGCWCEGARACQAFISLCMLCGTVHSRSSLAARQGACLLFFFFLEDVGS